MMCGVFYWRLKFMHKKQIKLSIQEAQKFIRLAQALTSGFERSSELISLLQEALRAEFQQWDLYHAYKDELKGLARDSIVDHFTEHASDEAEHISTLQRYLVSMGIQPTKEREVIPEIDALDPKAIIKLQLEFERKAVSTYRQILKAVEDTDPLRIEIEDILAKEQEHAHELELYLGDEEKKIEAVFAEINQPVEKPKRLTKKQNMLWQIQKAKLSVHVVKPETTIKLATLKNNMYKSGFLNAIGYRGDRSRFALNTSRQVNSAVRNLLDNRIMTLAGILSRCKRASLEENAEERYRKYSDEFQQWYKDTKEYWKNLVRHSQLPGGANINDLAEKLNQFFKESKHYDEFLQTGIRVIEENLKSFMEMIQQNMSEDVLQKPTIKKIYKELSETKESLEDADTFMHRLFKNILFEIGTDKEE